MGRTNLKSVILCFHRDMYLTGGWRWRLQGPDGGDVGSRCVFGGERRERQQ